MCGFWLEAYDVETEELQWSTKLPGYRHEDCMLMFQLTEDQYNEVRYDSHVVTAAHKADLEIMVGEEIDLNKYMYFVDSFEAETLQEAVKVIKDLVDVADYLRSGGVLDSLGHAPDGGKKWHTAVNAADEFLAEFDKGDE